MKYELTILAEDTPGVLAHIVDLIRRRSFNIATMSVGFTEEKNITRIGIVLYADNDMVIEQLKRQIDKLMNVTKVVNLTNLDYLARELGMVKVKADPVTRADIMNIVSIFRAHIIDINHETLVIELTGAPDKIDALIAMLEPYSIIEVARTASLTMCRGPVPIREM